MEPLITHEVLDRIKAKTAYLDDCWLYTGYLDKKGYGRIRFNYKVTRIHRVSAHLYHGMDLSDNEQQALHKKECPNRHCWNPEHIYIGNNLQNNQDKKDLGTGYSPNKFKTHCPMGHEYNEENTRLANGSRHCKECDRIKHNANYRRSSHI